MAACSAKQISRYHYNRSVHIESKVWEMSCSV